MFGANEPMSEVCIQKPQFAKKPPFLIVACELFSSPTSKLQEGKGIPSLNHKSSL